MAASETVGAIDIGSNSIKLTVGWLDGDGDIVERSWPPETVRLGAGLEETGRLADDRMDAATDAVRRFVDLAREAGADRIVAVATEATRVAANGAAFLARLRRETGIDVRTIDGDQEARLTFRGLAATTDLTGSALVADVGGGSTELIAARDGDPSAMRSLSLGAGRLPDRLIRADPPTAAELAACEDAAATALGQSVREMRPASEESLRLIVVGGTGEYLQRLVEREPADRADVASVLAELTRIPAHDLAQRLGIADSRARVLPAGIAIVAAIAGAFDATRIDMARSGVRLGVLMEALRPVQVTASSRGRGADG